MNNNTPPPVREIILKNIQSFASAKIELPPPGEILAITGESDAGKTALASRALRKLFFNDIPTKQLIRRGAKSASITATYDTPDNLSISWEWRGRSVDSGKARYVIRRDGMEPIVLEGAGKQGHVPEQVQEITQVRPVKVGNLSLNFNFNKQLDGPFLGSISPSDRYRVLGALAGTEEVDQAVDEVGLEIVRGRRNEKQLDTDIKALDSQIAAYDYLVELGKQIDNVQDWVALIQSRQDKVAGLWGLSNDIAAWEDELKESSREASNLDYLTSNLFFDISITEVILSLFERLGALRSQIATTDESIKRIAETVEKTATVDEGIALADKLTRKNEKLVAIRKPREVMQAEMDKLARAVVTLDATQNAQEAAQSLEKVSVAHDLKGILMRSQADISASKDMVLRSICTLEQTAMVDDGADTLEQVRESVLRLHRLARIRGLSQLEAAKVADINAKLKVTAGVSDVSARVDELQKQYDRWVKLALARVGVQEHGRAAKVAGEAAGRLAVDVEAATGEYRELLAEVGICEDCKVVAEVMATG